MPTGKEFTARGRDLSATGIRIIHSDRVATGQRIAMELTTVDEKQIVVIGRVQWCKPSEFGQDKIELGVKFLAFG
ncbi:MAG: PilZ domain-containing protein [Planctomycetales bacterium]|nr:PilZ domain-containing protein [Planctomycetales bacterium]